MDTFRIDTPIVLRSVEIHCATFRDGEYLATDDVVVYSVLSEAGALFLIGRGIAGQAQLTGRIRGNNIHWAVTAGDKVPRVYREQLEQRKADYEARELDTEAGS